MENLENKTEEKETLTFTQEELDALINSKADARVTEALKTQSKKFEKQKQEAVDEATKVAQMNEQQKAQYEIELKQKELDAKIAELNLEKSKNSATKLLNDKKLSIDLLDFVVCENEDTMKQRVDTLANVFNNAVNAAAEQRISSSSPKKSESAGDTITKDGFKNMGLEERTKILREDPELYEQLRGSN